MSKPSLTPDQQAEVRRRLAAGEGIRALAREFRVGVATISRLSDHAVTVRSVAAQLADAQNALAALPVAQQHMALSLADKIRAASDSMADVAVLGADTARHLHQLANAAAKKVISENLERSADSLRLVAGLTKMANDAAVAPLSLIAATKGKADEPPADSLPTIIELVDPTKLSDQTLSELLAARDAGSNSSGSGAA